MRGIRIIAASAVVLTTLLSCSGQKITSLPDHYPIYGIFSL